MKEAREEFLDIVKEVRAHLEYQRTLGVTSLEFSPTVLPGSKKSEKGEAPPPESSLSGGMKEDSSVSETADVGADRSQAGSLDAVRAEIGNCTRCKLHRERKTIVFGEGSPKALLVFIGEGPGYEEDQQGRPFVGAAGELLTRIIEKAMKLRRQDVYICNIVKCRPPGNRNPEPDEIQTCEPFLVRQLEAIRPNVIVALGNISARTLLKTSEGITKLRGRWQSYEGIPLMPTYHPAYLLRNPKDKALVWEDIKKVMAEMERQKGE